MTRQANGLIEASLETIKAGQTVSGAFLASPNFPNYRYCWFRDGAFIAQALDLWGECDSAARFYEWGSRTILKNRDVVEAVLSGPPDVVPHTHLHTRYGPDGRPADNDWPTFQLDGFGTFLWGLVEHLELTRTEAPPAWRESVDLVVAYLGHLWRSPNFDCWEEYSDRVHISTLCALHGGAAAVARHMDHPPARTLAEETRDFVRGQSSGLGYLPKFVGSDSVDSSLLWANVPFEMLDAGDSIMSRTVEKIEADLVGPSGGVHRYAADVYYGGGEWILLTALLGEYWTRVGKSSQAMDAMAWIEERPSNGGHLAEQVPIDLIAPDQYEPWVHKWGPIACPLLWSHASYLRLKHALAE